MAITIRKLLPTDSSAYRRFRLACLAQYPTSFGSSAEEESQTAQLPFEQHLQAEATGTFLMGAFDETELVGMSGFGQAGRRKLRHHGDITQVCVSPSHLGRGIGRALVRKTIEAAFALPEIEQVHLGVITDNVAANALYKSLGFEECGVQKEYLKINEQYFDHRLMVLSRSAFNAASAA